MLKIIHILRALLLVSGLAMTFAAPTLAAPVTAVSIKQVRVTGGPFLHAQQTNIDYLMSLDPDRLLAPYRIEAGLPARNPKTKQDKPRYPNWEDTGLDGHIGGHYITALSLAYAATGDRKIKKRLNYMLNELEKCQLRHKNGYLGGVPNGDKLWAEVKAGNIQPDLFSLNGAWVPLYNIHKIFAGLRDAYVYTDSQQAKAMLVHLSDWLLDTTSALSDAQVQQLLISEHGGLNEVLADVYEITGDKRYLQEAIRFTHLAIMEPLIQKQDKLTGLHANTQIPKIIGAERVAEETDDNTLADAWHKAAEFFWKEVVTKRTVAIGGNSVREHFHPKDDFSSMVEDKEGPETCNTYNMLKLSKMLYQQSGDTRYLDYYERALYNHILSSQHPDHGGLVYFTSMRPNHYRVYSSPQLSFWCCVGSGIENHSKYGAMVYATNQLNELYVNLFIDSTLNMGEQGWQLTQTTLFPDTQTTQLTVQHAASDSLHIRYPRWVKKDELKVSVNGQPVAFTAMPGDYVTLTRAWQTGDTIDINLPMHKSLSQLPDGKEYYAAVYGPIVLAAKTNPFPDEQLNYIGDDSRMGHIASGQLCPPDQAPIFLDDPKLFLANIKPVEGLPLTFTTGATSFVHDEKLTLIPFFRLHDSRYTLYFPHATRSGWAKMKDALQAKAAAEAKLAAQTLDVINPGEQQPEADHFFKAENSEAGLNQDKHWRHAHGWFSYQMQAKGQASPVLRLTYFGIDTNRQFRILIDDKELTTVTLEGGKGPIFYDVDYPIPSGLIHDANQPFRVKFEALPGSIAGGLYGIRLMNP